MLDKHTEQVPGWMQKWGGWQLLYIDRLYPLFSGNITLSAQPGEFLEMRFMPRANGNSYAVLPNPQN